MRISIFDDGAGNVHSLAKVLAERGDVVHSNDVDVLLDADLTVLPGVGAFDPAVVHLGPSAKRLADALRDGQPCIAICLGMQLLFESSDEGDLPGLGVLSGRVRRLAASRIPHIGWERIDNAGEPTVQSSGLCWGYYAHSYACPEEGGHEVTAWSTLEGVPIPATLRYARTLGVQFHPEKSSAPGVAMVRAFLEEVSP
jgi:glutamine amidotransferase